MMNYIDSVSSENEPNLTEYEATEQLLSVMEKAGMSPPGYMKPIPFDEVDIQYPLVPGDFKNEGGIWCTPGVQEWEPEDETK